MFLGHAAYADGRILIGEITNNRFNGKVTVYK